MTRMNMGRFQIDASFVHSDPDGAADIFLAMRFVPVRAEMLFAEYRMDYVGMSPLFSEGKEGCLVPAYELEIKRDKDGNVVNVDAKPKEDS